MGAEEVRQEIERKLASKVHADARLHNVHMLVHSDRLNIHWAMAAGSTGEAHPDQPFHTASVGKTFTSVIVARLVEDGHATFEDPIAAYLPSALMDRLHVYKGKDYSQDIRIKHLLSHTSGLPDFYEEKPKRGKPFMQEVFEDPARFWTAEETVLWSKAHLEPRFPPGEGLHYTDTGYNLLGLLIESITSKRYEEALHEFIFQPLQMNHSYLAQYSEPAVRSEYSTAQLNWEGRKIRVDEYRSLSSFYAGGQTVCTTEDLLRFMQALVQNRLVKEDSLRRMQSWHRMGMGLDYGYGLMKLQFLPFTSKYTAWGHLGASGAFLLYAPSMDAYLAGSFNQTAYRRKGIHYLFVNVMRKLAKLDV